jgi:hypothetical protein
MHTPHIIGRGIPSSAMALIAFLSVMQCFSQVSVTTWHNENGRTGQNTQESHFYTSGSNKLNKNNFGLLCSFATQGQVYAQPLVVAHTNDNGMDVYVADMQDYLYKFTIPASGGCPGTPTTVNLLQGLNEVPVDCNFIGSDNCKTIKPTVGVLSTGAGPCFHRTQKAGAPSFSRTLREGGAF